MKRQSSVKFSQAQSFSGRVKGNPVIFETNFRQQTDRQLDRGFKRFSTNVSELLNFSIQFHSGRKLLIQLSICLLSHFGFILEGTDPHFPQLSPIFLEIIELD